MRFLVGVALAGVYAPGVRLVATYFTVGRGMATGAVVGALTLGSGTLNLVRGVGGEHWQVTIVVTSALALVAALVVSPVRAGPAAAASPPLNIWAAARDPVWTPARAGDHGLSRPHVELYPLWAWRAAFFAAARQAATGMVPSIAETGPVTCLAIGVAGLAVAVAAGHLADRIGHTTVTSDAIVPNGLGACPCNACAPCGREPP